MRKVTEQIVEAFIAGKSKTVGNTTTDGNSIWLHSNKIVSHLVGTDKIILTLAGWNTPTTRERINGLADRLNKPRIYQSKFRAMREGVEISTTEWLTL